MPRNKKLPVVNFSFDDAHANDAQVVELFERYNLTCGFAFICRNDDSTGMQDKYRLYKQYQDRGFDVCCHGLGDSDTFKAQTLTVLSTSISSGSGTINFTLGSRVINTEFTDLLVGSITKLSGNGDDEIAYSNIQRVGNTNEYIFAVSGIADTPVVGETYQWLCPIPYAKKMFATAQERCAKYGIVLNGWITPNDAMNAIFEDSIDTYFAYAFAFDDSYHSGRQSNPCRLERLIGMQNSTLETIKTNIQNGIANDKFINLWGHPAAFDDQGTWNIALVESVIQYCIGLYEQGLIYLGGVEDGIRDYYGVGV